MPPTSWASTQARPAAIESSTILRLAGSGSAASLAERPVLIFSQTRGTPKNAVGCTSPSAAEQLGRVADGVHVAALDLRAVEAEHPLGDVRERQVADRRSGSISPAASWVQIASKSTLWWVSTTPFGFPVVPDV